MGALAPVSSWIPEDDLLLKNAVEAGASLESLAKGAVQFSRKFTVRELQERWYSLLYDPIISAEAAFCMIEFERSAATLPSKFCRTGNSRENKCVSGKRKVESVRNCYYALHKRIRNEPFNAMDLSFLLAPTDNNYVGNEDEPFSEHCILGDPISNQFGLQESNLDLMHHTLPEIRDDITAHDFHAEFRYKVQEDYLMKQDNVHKEISHICGENVSHTANDNLMDDFCGPKHLPVNDDQVRGCSKFGDQVFSSPTSGCGMSFHNLEYSSPLSEMPIWGTVEGVSPPSIPHNMDTGGTFSLPGDGDTKNTCLPEFDIYGHSNLKLEIPSEEMKNVSGSTEVYLAELSNSLLNFTNEEELLFTDGGKDTIDKSCYDGPSSLLLSSPTDVNQGNMPDITEPDVTLDCLTTQSGTSNRNLDENGRHHHGDDIVVNSEVQHLNTASASNPQLPEQSVEVINCMLNTEDTEIPCNDDVVFTNHLHSKPFSSMARRNFYDASKLNSSTVMDFSSISNASEGVLVATQRDQEPPEQSHAYSQILRSQVIQETGSLHPDDDHGIQFNVAITNPAHSSVSIASKNDTVETLLPVILKEETPEVVLMKHFCHNLADCSIQKLAVGLDGHKCFPPTGAYDVKQDLDPLARVQNHPASDAKMGSVNITAPEQVVNNQVSRPEEPHIESGDDMPYFSDIEAMILDMDLDPEDQELCSSEEVSRYQQEDAKRVIVRLEQGAHSYLQRAIASHGAFAVLYGRHSKHYIRKPEVLLGRGTEDVIVDIDLGREGRANKVSRRQATIKLDKSGSFHLKNLGKCSILVNDKEIAPGQSLSLTSSCLIEIRGMPFIFEANQTCVKQHLDCITQKS